MENTIIKKARKARTKKSEVKVKNVQEAEAPKRTRRKGKEKEEVSGEVRVEKKKEISSEDFSVFVVNSNQLKEEDKTKDGFVLAVKQGSTEVWIDVDVFKKRIICKIPTKQGYPKTFEFTPNQFVSFLAKAKEVRAD